MFIVEFQGNREIFQNEIADDFMQYLPNHFGCEPVDLKVWYVNPKDARQIALHPQRAPGNAVDLSEAGIVKLVQIKPGQPVPPQFNVGDPDPDSTSTPPATIQVGDPRTLPTAGPLDVTVMAQYQATSIQGWPYDETGKFTGIQLAS